MASSMSQGPCPDQSIEPSSASNSLLRQVLLKSKTWRSSVAFVTTVVGVGIALDTLNANIVVAVFPFRLEELHYPDISISGLVGWLLFLYSIGLVVSTPVIAVASERLGSRRGVMVAGQFSLLGSQLLLMMAPMFWVMCIGRFLEGIASAVIMTAGLALICDTTPDKDIGGQLGMAMIGMPFGALVGPPVGGALYKRWGYKAPFIFSILFTVVDITCRLLVIEKPVSDRSLGRHSLPKEPKRTEAVGLQPVQPSAGLFNEAKEPSTTVQVVATAPVLPVREDTAANKLPVIDILVQFASSPRLLTSLVVVFVCSFVFSAADVTIPLCLQNVWGFDSRRVGLAYLAAIIPTLISNPLAGVLADRFGPQWIAILFTICGTPWWGAMTTTFSLPFFIFSYGIENFFVAAVAPPMTAELAAITRTMKGVGYAHTYGTFNIVMGTANAVGSIVAGQVYGHSNRGWDILCYIHIGLLGLALIAMMTFTGEKPFLRGGSWKLGKHASIDAAMENSAEGDQNGPTA